MKPIVLSILLCLPVFAYPETERLACPLKVRDQGGTSLCWLHAGLQMMEQMVGESLSIDALVIPEIKSRALARYLGHDTPWDGGAGPTRPFALALEHGVVPESIWNKNGILVQNYHQVFEKIESLLKEQKPRAEFMAGVDAIIKSYTGSLPPSARSHKREFLNIDLSLGYDVRDVKYDDSKYGRMGEVAWTTVISRQGELVKITDIIAKKVIRETPDQAWDRAVRMFRAKKPVALTFIWFDHEGKTVLGLNRQTNQFESRRPSTHSTYMGSHLVLVTGLVSENGQVTAFEVDDSVTNGTRLVTKEFFRTHGKTIHAVANGCEDYL